MSPLLYSGKKTSAFLSKQYTYNNCFCIRIYIYMGESHAGSRETQPKLYHIPGISILRSGMKFPERNCTYRRSLCRRIEDNREFFVLKGEYPEIFDLYIFAQKTLQCTLLAKFWRISQYVPL